MRQIRWRPGVHPRNPKTQTIKQRTFNSQNLWTDAGRLVGGLAPNWRNTNPAQCCILFRALAPTRSRSVRASLRPTQTNAV